MKKRAGTVRGKPYLGCKGVGNLSIYHKRCAVPPEMQYRKKTRCFPDRIRKERRVVKITNTFWNVLFRQLSHWMRKDFRVHSHSSSIPWGFPTWSKHGSWANGEASDRQSTRRAKHSSALKLLRFMSPKPGMRFLLPVRRKLAAVIGGMLVKITKIALLKS